MKKFLSENQWPLLIALAAIAVRVLYVAELSRLPEFAVPIVDQKWNWEWANEIVDGSFWGQEAYFRAPLYAYFLAILSWITSGSVVLSKLLQTLLTGGTIWFLYRLTEHLFDRKTAVIAGLIYALYGTLVFYETTFLRPGLFLFLMVWGMQRLVVYRESALVKTWLWTGVILGLAATCRPNILLVIPFLMIWLLMIRGREQGWLRRARSPLVLAAGVVLMIMPVTIRNAVVTGDFILISSQGGINLYLGNNPESDGLTMLMPEVDLDESVSWRDFRRVTRAVAEREAGRELSEARLSSFWARRAVTFMTEHPDRFLTLLWKKTVYLLSGFENSDNADIYHRRTKSVLYSLLVWSKPFYFPFGLLLPLAVMGLYVTRERSAVLRPIYIFMLAYIPSIILFLVTARHRLPLVPFMIMLAAGGVVTLVRNWPRYNRRQLAVVAVITLGLGVVFNRTYYDEGHTSPFQAYVNEGIKYEQLGDLLRAEQAYLQAARTYPYSATLLNNLAHVQMRLGRLDVAGNNFQRAIALKPEFAAAYNNLGLLMSQTDNADSAVVLYRTAIQNHNTVTGNPEQLAQYHLNLAEAFAALARPDSAELYYRTARQIAPGFARAYFKGAAFYARQESYARADSLYRLGLLYGPLGPHDQFNWGLSYLKRQEFSTAIDMMYRVISEDTAFYQAYYVIAVGYFENNLPEDSVRKYLELALRHNPSYAPALRLQEMMAEQRR
ncbi:MAG: glycosyltransferase family 39 protein [Candidatus Zixiibacteriota bacterium]|nr:MAG: glycosyltransferase family 39 protein [candidate division Zixibacteria bacterium]